MEFDQEYANSLGVSKTLRGSDPVVRHLTLHGRPLTRTSYLQAAGLEEPLDAETEAYLHSLELK